MDLLAMLGKDSTAVNKNVTNAVKKICRQQPCYLLVHNPIHLRHKEHPACKVRQPVQLSNCCCITGSTRLLQVPCNRMRQSMFCAEVQATGSRAHIARKLRQPFVQLQGMLEVARLHGKPYGVPHAVPCCSLLFFCCWQQAMLMQPHHSGC